MVLADADKARIASAIRMAEAATSGEIVCVAARASADSSLPPLLAALAPALLLPWPLIALTQLSAQRIYVLQLLVFIAAALVFSAPALRRWLVPRSFARAQAHRAAAEQFLIRKMSRTRERTGVLIFVSLAERYARILVDDGVAEKVAPHEWQAIVDALVAQARAGRLTEGFIGAVAACGEVLARHFPAGPDNLDELPDRVFLI